MYCSKDGTKLIDGACTVCASKSVNSLSVETLEKALNDLESIGKGVRPAEAKFKGKDERTAKEVVEDAEDQIHSYGDHGEGDSEEEPKTKKNVESAAKGGFMPGAGAPPPPPPDEDEEEREREEEEERERGGGGAPPMPFKSAKGKAKKSMQTEMEEDDDIRKAVDVSPFLEALTGKISEHVDALRGDVNKSLSGWQYQQRYNVGLAKALGELGNLVKGLADVVKSFSNIPAGGRKGDVTVVEKSFGDTSNPVMKNQSGSVINKSDIANKLLNLKVAGDNTIEDIDIFRAESSGVVRPELVEKLNLKN